MKIEHIIEPIIGGLLIIGFVMFLAQSKSPVAQKTYSGAAKIGIGFQKFNLIGAYIFGTLFIIAGIVYMFSKPKPDDDDDNETKHIGGGALITVLGVVVILASRWNLKMMKKHKGYAAVAGTSDMIELTQGIFSHKK